MMVNSHMLPSLYWASWNVSYLAGQTVQHHLWHTPQHRIISDSRACSLILLAFCCSCKGQIQQRFQLQELPMKECSSTSSTQSSSNLCF